MTRRLRGMRSASEALSEIVQKTEARLEMRPPSLYRRLFACGAVRHVKPFQADLFDAVLRASGSMWYPNFAEYVEAGKRFERPLRVIRILAWVEGAHAEPPFARRRSQHAARVAANPEAKGVKLLSEAIRQPFQRARCAHGEGDLLGGFELWREFAIEIEGVRVETRVVDGNSERFAECLRYCSFRCECSACRRFPINVDDC